MVSDDTCDCPECNLLRAQFRRRTYERGNCPSRIWPRISAIYSRETTEAKPMNRFIQAMGVELEGAWDEQPHNLHHDGSVQASGAYRGECQSPALSDWAKLRRFMLDNHPDHTDKSCGLHVHFSLPRLGMYSRLMDSDFGPYFYSFMETWGKKHRAGRIFKERLDGMNRYCLKRWAPDLQAIQSGKTNIRYAAWNFCYSIHRTAECRLLPMFDAPEMAVKGVQAVKLCVMLFLRGNKTEPELLAETNLDELEQKIKSEQPQPSIESETVCV